MSNGSNWAQQQQKRKPLGRTEKIEGAQLSSSVPLKPTQKTLR